MSEYVHSFNLFPILYNVNRYIYCHIDLILLLNTSLNFLKDSQSLIKVLNALILDWKTWQMMNNANVYPKGKKRVLQLGTQYTYEKDVQYYLTEEFTGTLS